MEASIPGYCTLCRSRCGTLNTVVDDQLIAVRPNPSHPTGKAMCMKGRAAPELVASPHRQLFPMRRTNPKTAADPGWVQISWDEALKETAERLLTVRQESGAEAVAFSVTTPSGTPLSDSIDWIERFVRHFGSPNTCYGTETCNWHKDFAHAFTFGCGMPPADYAHADTILLWGHNPTNTWLAQANAIGVGRAKGAKLVVVDPRPTALAKQADVWLPVRPGTDGALALGILRIMIERELFDDAFVARWTNAAYLVRADTSLFLRERDLQASAAQNRYMVIDRRTGRPVPVDRPGSPAVMLSDEHRGAVQVRLADGRSVECVPALDRLWREAEPFDGETVRKLTGVEPEAMERAAELLSGERRIAYHSWTGIGQHTNATQTERAIACIYALSGSFDRVGGNRVRYGPDYRPVNALGHLAPGQMGKALGLAERPIGPPSMGWITARDMYTAVLEGEPYRVRAMVAFGTNLPVSQADTDMAAKALEALEFHVHCDLFETPAARYADIFLPINTPWEREGLRFGFEIDDEAAAHVQLRRRMVTPRGQSRSDTDIVFDLACRMGMADDFFGGSLEGGWNYMLQPLGLSVNMLREQPAGIRCEIDARERKYATGRLDGSGVGFATSTGRVELYSERLASHGQPGAPTYVESAEGRRLERSGRGRRFPLLLSSAKNGYFCHSQHRSLVTLRKRAPDPIAEIGPVLASERGVQDGDWIRVSTRVGEARFVARVVPGLANDVVIAEFGWWQACPELDRPALAIEGAAGSNANGLVSAEEHDPVSGSIAHRSFRCEIHLDPLTASRHRGWKGFRKFHVRAVHEEAVGVRSVLFEPVDGDHLPDYRPGQHIQLRIPGGDALLRAYSLTGAASEEDRTGYAIAVRHQRGVGTDGAPFEGLMSSHVHRLLREGDVVDLTAPSGSFLVPRYSPQPLVFLAGGIGITPFISLLESLTDGDGSEIHLYYANLNGGTHAFRDRIQFHQSRLPNLRVVNHYDAPLPTDILGRHYSSAERISSDVVPSDLIVRRARVYMCGPPPMMKAFSEGLVKRGMPRFDIFSEIFRSPTRAVSQDGGTFTVTFATGTERKLTWSGADGTLLDLAEKAGLQLPSGCRVGQCESCAMQIRSGSVRHLHGEEPDDPSVCLICQAVPSSDIVLGD